VTAPLLGPNGAAHVFGPQKGASVADVRLLEMGLTTLTEVAGARALAPAPGAGAAGGTAFGLTALWGGSTGRVRIEPGAAFIARHTRLDELLERADVLITGEGSFDEQSLLGKTVGHAVTVAARHRVRRWVIAGHVASSPGFPPEGCTTLSLTELAGSADAAIASPARFLEWSAARAARATH
jgi:glycerate kinase